MNTLFDVFNTKNDCSENLFKKTLTTQNLAQILEFFDSAIDYIKKLEVINDKGKSVKVCSSIINTGFSGWIINMISLKLLFQDFVTERAIFKSIRTFDLQQDQVYR